MEIEDALRKVGASYSNRNTADIESGAIKFHIDIGTSKGMCTVCASTAIVVPKQGLKSVQDKIDALNKGQTGGVYQLSKDNSALEMRSVLWIDRKPTVASLNDLIGMMEASLISSVALIENGDDSYE